MRLSAFEGEFRKTTALREEKLKVALLVRETFLSRSGRIWVDGFFGEGTRRMLPIIRLSASTPGTSLRVSPMSSADLGTCGRVTFECLHRSFRSSFPTGVVRFQWLLHLFPIRLGGLFHASGLPQPPSSTDPRASPRSVCSSKCDKLQCDGGNSIEHRHSSFFLRRKPNRGDVD